MKIKTYILILLFAAISQVARSQNPEGLIRLREVREQLKISKPDTNRVLLYIDLCNAFQWNDKDSLELYSNMALELARQINFPRGEVRILNNLGIASSFRGDVPKAMDYLFPALQLAQHHRYVLETAMCLNSIGACYFFLDDYKKSIDLINQARNMIEGVTFSGPDRYWKIYINFWCGATYSDLEKSDSAKIFLQKAYTDAFDNDFIDLYSMRPTIMMFYGELLFKTGNHDQAFYDLHSSIAEYEVNNDWVGLADASAIMATFFKELKKPDSLIYYAKKGLDAATRFNYSNAMIANSKLLTDQYESIDVALSHHYLKILQTASDSLYGVRKIQKLQKAITEEQQRQQQIKEQQINRENQLKEYGFIAGLIFLLIIAAVIYKNSRQQQKAKLKIETAYIELKNTQAQLIQSEKMASLGELTAGIAHEIQNPLNFVNNFSDVNKELLEELKEEADNGNIEEIKAIANDVINNEEKINHHGKRADAIVKNMLQHSRSSGTTKELTDINKLADEYLRLSYHGLRVKDKGFNADFKTEFDESIAKINIIPQDIGRVLLNLINNAFYAINEKKKTAGENYKPLISVRTKKINNNIEIAVTDNGKGIPASIKEKIFQPFFTTKPTGQGTGLGLSLSYDIVKVHGGEIKVESKEGEGSEFIIQLPAKEAI